MNKFPSKEDLEEAFEAIAPYIHRTPVLDSQYFDDQVGGNVYFKAENFQKAGAFKMRGAAYAVSKLTDKQKKKGVCTHSSGNHAQALARSAQIEKIPAYIVMPSNAPEVKKAAVKEYDGQIIICQPTLAAREKTLEQVQRDTDAIFIPPYDHPHIIAGQATAAMELLDDLTLDFIIVPVGGGGLLAGSALAAHYFSPKTQVIGAEPSGADDAYRSLYSGERVKEHQPSTIADGLLTTLGKLNFEIIKTHVKEIHTVSDSEIIVAMRAVYERMKVIIEPSCAVPVAVLLKHKEKFKNKKVGIILSGGNIDVSNLPF
ncbi:MAG: threonine/serine dehydratase [Cyclobacteriaceae bacterium]|nr:threonine/serine dehydratase [Cyclobacteriaceae bacterium]MCH8516602.1 threonine/serine dehydratase [Cyclobacteriaceae bacterium]